MSGASPHVGAQLALAVDLQDFYGQIDFNRVEHALAERFDSDVLNWVEGACFVERTLPLGFRTSPALSNLAFEATDHRIKALADLHGITYTRWVDDLAFSGGDLDDSFLGQLKDLLGSDGWILNERKTRFMRRSPYVLGLYVGHDVDRPRLPRWVKQKILLETYHFSKHGNAHFQTPGVYPRRTLIGLCAYASFVEPELAARVQPRLASGIRVGALGAPRPEMRTPIATTSAADPWALLD